MDEELHQCPVNECSCDVNGFPNGLESGNGIGALGPDTMPCNNNVTTNPNNYGTVNNPDCDSVQASVLCPNHKDVPRL